MTAQTHELSWWLGRAGRLVVAVLVPVGVGLAFVPVRDSTPNATVALALDAVVCLLAAISDRLAAAVAAASAALAFDVWHTQPYGSLTISRAVDVETTLLLLAVALIVGQLAARNRTHRRLANEASYNLGRVHAVAEMVASGGDVDQVVIAVTNELKSVLRLRACWFDPAFADPPGPFIERNGSVSWGAIHWGFATLGMPSKEVSLIVEHNGLPFGRFVLVAEPGTRITEDELVTAVALADQAGVAIARQPRITG